MELVGAQQAEGLSRDAMLGSDGSRLDDVSGLLRVFHARHVGLPPALARKLSEGFGRDGRGDYSSALRLAIYRRLLDALGISEVMQRDPRQFDIVPRHLLVDICLLPLAAIVTADLDRTVIFSADRSLPTLQSGDYLDYALRFEERLLALCAIPTKTEGGSIVRPRSIDLFWERAAHRLWAIVQQRRHTTRTADAALGAGAELDGMALRFICGLEPVLHFDSDAARLRTELADEQNPLFSHPRQGGVVDIHATPRLDDIEDFLLTEFMVPRVLLVDKLLNGMSMAKHRPPPFDERRQLLVLGSALEDHTSSSLALARAAWLDAVFRFAIVLHKHELLGSELRFGRWTEGGGYGGSGIKVGDATNLGNLDLHSASRSQMRRFFCDAGWLPGLVAHLPQQPLGAMVNGQPGGSDIRRLDLVLRRLAPELAGSDLAGEDTDFRLAMLVSFTLQGTATQTASTGSSRLERLPLLTLGINCPAAFVAGETYVIEDELGQRSEIPVPGDSGRSPDQEALEQLSATLSEKIFKFYWDGADA